MATDLVVRNSDPMTILAAAVDAGRDPATLQALMDLAERYHANQAKAAYFAAMKQFKDNAPRLVKNATGHNSAKYTSLDHACAEIVPVLAKFGLSHRWITKVADGKISVTCVLSHEMGYSDPTPPQMEAGADTSGSKNAIQALGSAVKYLERYTFFAAIGLDDGSKPKDDDGNGGESLDDKAFAALKEKIEGATNDKDLQDAYLEALEAARKKGDSPAEESFKKAKNATYRQIHGGQR